MSYTIILLLIIAVYILKTLYYGDIGNDNKIHTEDITKTESAMSEQLPMYQIDEMRQMRQVRQMSWTDQLGGGGEEALLLNDDNRIFILEDKVFRKDGFITQWKFTANDLGTVSLCVLRKMPSGSYVIQGENNHQAIHVGTQIVTPISQSQLSYSAGDVIGFRCKGKNIIGSTSSTGAHTLTAQSTTALSVGSSVNGTSLLKDTSFILYALGKDIYTETNAENLGSKDKPAVSAQAILDYHKAKGLSTPVDGVYFIRKNKKAGKQEDPIEIYCNFTLRPGYGYMLVASVSPGGVYPNAGNFSSSFSQGQYDKYGRAGTYYLGWADIDRNAIADGDEPLCKSGGHFYNASGKYCGTKEGRKLRVKGGVTEIILSTGNEKHWMAVKREDLESNKTDIVPVASSNNFKEGCSVVSNSETLISMGSATSCNYIFWGKNTPLDQLGQTNNGIRIYIGTECNTGDKNTYSNNPSLQRAPGRISGKTTYAEAQMVCKALGKRVCTKKQLKEARDSGYGSRACGWTSTPRDKYSLFTTNAINIDLWAEDEKEQDCPTLPKATGQSDVYCCDPYMFSDFHLLDDKYKAAGSWIATLEQTFNDAYNSYIPTRTSFIVCHRGLGLAVQKKTETSYVPISHKDGTSPSHLDIKCQLTVPDTYTAMFLQDITSHNIKANIPWSATDGNLVHYGNIVKFQNGSLFLTASRNKYYHETSEDNGGNEGQVFGYAHSTADQWILQPTRDTDMSRPIRNGDRVYLYNTHSKSRMYLDDGKKAAGNVPDAVLITLSTKYNDTSDFIWKIITPSTYWHKNDSIRLMHENTGKLAQMTTTTYSTKPQGGTTVTAVVGSNAYDETITYKCTVLSSSASGSNKCKEYLRKIYATDVTAQSKEELQNQYNKECYNIKQEDYNAGVQEQISLIENKMALLNKETGRYNALYNKKKEITDKIAENTILSKKYKAEIAILRKKCQPVKRCVDGIYSETCRELENILQEASASEAPDIQRKISKTVSKNQNTQDITKHPDFPSYVPNASIKTC